MMTIHITDRSHAHELMDAGEISSFFEIVDQDNDPYRCGYDGNAFETREAAEKAIDGIRQFGEDWEAAERWRVREVRQ